jgi:hypothetical protein
MRLQTRRPALAIRIGLAALTIAALGACSANGSGDTSTNGSKSELDPKLGVIEFPLEQFSYTAAEDDVLSSAFTVKLAECANPQGVNFYASAPVHDIADTTSNFFGVWVKSFAEKYAFAGAQSDADLVANGIKGAPHLVLHGTLASRNNGKLTDKEWDTVNACHSSAKAFDSQAIAPTGPWSKSGGDAEDQALSSDAAKKVESDYDACLEEKGLEPDPENTGTVEGAEDRTISPQQIALALKVVDCKTQVHYVQRLSALVADAQAPIVAKYHKELVAQRQRIDAALVQAKKVIADYSADHPEFK